MCVLIVEDEPINLLGTALVLEDAGFEVKTAESGPAAVALIERFPAHFTCLLTDYSMPDGMNGADVILRMRKEYPDIPVILMSAMPDAVTPAWRGTHAVDLLPKPFEPVDLLRLLQSRGLTGSHGPDQHTGLR